MSYIKIFNRITDYPFEPIHAQRKYCGIAESFINLKHVSPFSRQSQWTGLKSSAKTTGNA